MTISEVIRQIPVDDGSTDFTFSYERRVPGISVTVLSVSESYSQFCLLSETKTLRLENPMYRPGFREHQHEYYEMMYIYQGDPQQQIEGERGQCEEGEL